MFNYFEVDGFRSLVKFKLKFRPGLNLFIGPNGSGKTNIISFLGFICDSAMYSLSEAVGKLGGSGTVFRKHGAEKYHSQIKAMVRGTVEPSWEDRPDNKKAGAKEHNNRLHYEYAFTIVLSDDREIVYFANQSLRFHIANKSFRQSTIKKWDAEILINGNSDGSVNCRRAEVAPSFQKEIKHMLARADGSLAKLFEERLNSESSIIPTSYMLIPREFVNAFYMDFQKRIIFNPNPIQIRMPEDSAKSPGIYPDGSGLYASLLALKRSRTKSPSLYRFVFFRPTDVPFNPKIKLDRLISFFQLAYPTMLNLDVTNDQFENTIRVRVTLAGIDSPQIPLAALSDGTLKWMSLVTAIFTNDSILAIEEPENFVHPFIQREALQIARDQTQNNSLLLMSSHSETILNAAEPEEVIVVSIKNGHTYARRVMQPKKLKQLVNESGFGLGFYYLSGALEDA